MDRDRLLREYRYNGASWPAAVLVYGLIVGALVLSGMAIT